METLSSVRRPKGPATRLADEDLKDALQRQVKETLELYKYPHAIEFVDELPMTSTEKLARATLREELTEGEQ